MNVGDTIEFKVRFVKTAVCGHEPCSECCEWCQDPYQMIHPQAPFLIAEAVEVKEDVCENDLSGFKFSELMDSGKLFLAGLIGAVDKRCDIDACIILINELEKIKNSIILRESFKEPEDA